MSSSSSFPIPISQIASSFPSILIPARQRIAAGEFWMGANAHDKFTNDTERPSHQVHIAQDFWLGVYPVSVAEYRCFAPDFEPGADPQWPVVGVSWRDSQDYCAWLSDMTGDTWRLPTEAEWEYAARAGSSTAYPWGDDITPSKANYYYDEHGNRIGPGSRTPVGAFPANAFGLHDMQGNVGEWIADLWHPTYEGAPCDGTAWLGDTGDAEPRRVLRGGAWDYLPRLLRSCWRDSLPEPARRDNLGFRVACDL